MKHPDIEQFIDSLHFGCIAVALAAADEDAVTVRRLIDHYLLTRLVNLPLGDERRVIVDRMAERIAAEGLDHTYGAYRGLSQ